MAAPLPTPADPSPGTAGPLVSVVLPTHDRPHRLGGALASVLAQTYRRLEVLVVDDASRHPVDAVVARAAAGDDRVRLVRLRTNRGAAGARNEGLARVTGELVAFVDDDDRWEPHKVARQVAYLEGHPEVGLVSCDYLIERETRPGDPVRFRGATSYSAEQLLWVNFPGSFSFVMARRRRLGAELHIDETFACAEDWDLWLRCARVAPAATLAEPLVRYVAHHEARLTDTGTKRAGLERFERKHGSEMTGACRAFHRAHQRMDTGAGLAKRAHVLRALATPSPRASALLVREQLARQRGRLRRDPGLVDRTLARLVARPA